ncbi:hypothetical protein DFP73DRAFT_473014 [Morchella snyderi]|nr:hypothetical protein DFP73DRAFT_473014 [Morchella snyderi]
MGTCTALNIHDSASPCVELATNANGQFCQFHARQVQGLYEGYKRRSLELESLEKNAPKCLPRNFGNTDFTAVKTLPQLKEIYAYMLQRYNLVTRCVMARDFHHSHFYADKSDFGHQAYLERLRSTRALLTTTLGRLEKRTLDVQYSNAQWYDWVESIQAEMDAKSEAEKKKVKAEAALFKAHQENVSKLRDEEEVRRRIQIEKEEVWDPIEEIIEDARAGYVALIRAFLMRGHMGTPALSTSGLHVQSHEEGVKEELERRNRKRISEMDKIKREESEEEEPKKKEQSKKKKGKKGKKNRSSEKVPAPMVESDHGEEIGNAEGTQEAPDSEDDPLDIDAIRDQDMKAIIQSITDLVIANQPALGINVDSEGGSGKVRAEVRVVHEYLLLRSIIASPSLLSAAILSSSIDEFLRDTVHVRNSDLRDLALDLSKPSDDSIRDACADYWAGEKMGNLESTGDDELSNELVVHQPKPKDDCKGNKKGKRGRSEHAPQVPEKGGKMDRVKICGKWIYNYPAETKMPRRGWFQFAILTGTSFFTAASLCKSWQEFYELNILSLNGYFRGLKNGWDTTRESPPLAHLRRIGFIPYALSHNSIHASGFTQTSRHSGSCVRLHAATEARNYIAANMSRDDPRVYRFIEILKTHRSELIVYIKDCKSGQTLVDPPMEERWIIRDKIGAGRLHRGKWTIRHPFDKAFKATLERERLWQSFRDCLDVVIWDRLPARPPEHLQYTLMKV